MKCAYSAGVVSGCAATVTLSYVDANSPIYPGEFIKAGSDLYVPIRINNGLGALHRCTIGALGALTCTKTNSGNFNSPWGVGALPDGSKLYMGTISGTVKVCDRDSVTGAVSPCVDTGFSGPINVYVDVWIDVSGSKAFVTDGNQFCMCAIKGDGTFDGCVYGTAPTNTFIGSGAGGILIAGGG